MKEIIYVSFHIGRGGRFHNAGYVTFRGEYDFQKLLNICSDVLFEVKETFDEDGNEVTLAENEWYVHDCTGRHLLDGRSEMEARTGVLNFDEDYDTDVTRKLEDCDDKEWDALRRAYFTNERLFMSEPLKTAIREYFDINE